MATNRMQATEESVAAFIDKLPDPVRREDARLLATIMERLSGEPPVMWGTSIIGVGNSQYRYDSGRAGAMPELGFSPRAKEQVLYVLGFPEQDALLARLGKHRTGKSCLYVKRLADIDMDVLEEVLSASLRHTRANRGADN